MLRRASWKVSGRLSHAPSLTQCGRSRVRPFRIVYPLNRTISISACEHNDAGYSSSHSTRCMPSPRPTGSTSATRNATAPNEHRRAAHSIPSMIDEDSKTPMPGKKNKTRLSHPNGQDYTHMQFLTKILDRESDCESWEHVAARSRFMSLPIVLSQIIMRRRAVRGTEEGDRLLELLPSETEMQQRIQQLEKKRHLEKDALRFCADVLGRDNDNQRCQHMLKHEKQLPIQILHFILRPNSTLGDIPTLRSLIDFHTPDGTVSLEKPHTKSNLRSSNYLKILSLLGKHLARTEPRLLVNVAGAASVYLKQFVETGNSQKRYVSCCKLFNRMLQVFQPEPKVMDKQIPVANAYFWECQRMLLTMSESFERPLQVAGDGFRAIRNTLAGMPKNETEKHSALLHAPSWPPYLTPGDGMDEITDPETNWSRTVEAGMLMQEAGFAKSEADDSLDILKGMAPDGTPTIQQRTLAGSHRTVGRWEASIRATRDAHEAWGRFNDPPTKGAKPGVNEYAAMFSKLTLREAMPSSKLLPGDKAQNFPAYRAANLADIEWAKSRPPSVGDLYAQMRFDGIIPSGHCLFILVSNAPDLDTAHRYLDTAAELDPDISSLTAPRIEHSALRRVGMGLFSAYINMLVRRDDTSGWENIQRAIALAEARLGNKRSRWVSIIWGAILKGSSRHHSALRMSQPDQVELIMAIAERIDRGHRLNLANFTELNKSLRKLIRYDFRALITEVHEDDAPISTSTIPLQALYETVDWSGTGAASVKEQPRVQTPVPGSLRSLVEYIKGKFEKFHVQEGLYQAAARDSYISPLDRMLSRNDVVKSEHALEYMLTLGYAGEFQEMKRLLLFLIREWGQPALVQDLAATDELPPSADFSELLCVFRILGERMLGGPAVAEEMQDTIVESGLPWIWPDAAAVEAYLEMHPHNAIRHVHGTFLQMQTRKRVAATQEPATLDSFSNMVDKNRKVLDSDEAFGGPGQDQEVQWADKGTRPLQ